jgi:hypothetical protein
MPLVEEVFTLSGLPSHTFVSPARFDEMRVSVRTPGRCIVVEGPSGIGKTTSVSRIVEDLNLASRCVTLSARRPADLDIIPELPGLGDIGLVVVDDFHRLSPDVKASLSDYMKLLADTSDPNSKLVLIGINKAGQQLVKFADDLGLRIDVFRLEANPDEKILELISRGEAALNVKFANPGDIVGRAQGSFQIAQLLCHKLCVLSNVTETQAALKVIELPIDVVIEDVMIELGRQFKEISLAFARGSKLRKEGRAPYLHILRWLADSEEWSLDISEALRVRPTLRGSIGQVLEKGYLADLVREGPLSQHFHFEPTTSVLSVDDPKLVFYLKNLVWRAFTRQVGFTIDYFPRKYDFALSFAGPQRAFAERLYEILTEREVAVFYDHNEQHRIIARDVEQYLAPIYRSEAAYVVPLLSPDYPTRIWTKFESDNFKERFGTGAVIPVRFTTVQEGYFSDEAKYGGLKFDPTGDTEAQLQSIADVLCKRIIEDRGEQDEPDERDTEHNQTDLPL